MLLYWLLATFLLSSLHLLYCFCRNQLVSEYQSLSSGLPDPLLYSLPSAASLIYWTFLTDLGKNNEKIQNWKGGNKSSKDAGSGVWSKGSCPTLKSSNLSLVFQNRSESSALFPLLPEPTAELCQVQKLTRLLHSSSLWLAARERE